MKLEWIIAGIVLTCLVVGAIIFVPHQNDQKIRFNVQSSISEPILELDLPTSPSRAPLYRVVFKEFIFNSSPDSLKIKANIPSEKEAPVLAKKALEKYGGLPKDAVLQKVVRNTIKKYNTKTGIVEEEYPLATQVIFSQEINGSPVIGPGAEINIELGENGELLDIEKAWRHLEYAGDVPIISAGDAFEKLKKGELIEVPQSGITGLSITEIKLGYYAQHCKYDQQYYTPVWIFYGRHQRNSIPFPYPVDAVKSNPVNSFPTTIIPNITATPTVTKFKEIITIVSLVNETVTPAVTASPYVNSTTAYEGINQTMTFPITTVTISTTNSFNLTNGS